MGFASGFQAGANVVNAYNERKRREKLDERDTELHNIRMQEVAQAKADKQGMRDAGAERTTMQGTVTEAGGNKYLSADPVQATKMQEMLAAEAEMTGAPAPTQQAGTGITGNMARGHQITTEPVDLKAINGPEAVSERQQAEFQRQGKPLEAMQMSNAVIDNKAKRLGLSVAEMTFAEKTADKAMRDALKSGKTWYEGAGKFITESQFPGIKDVKDESEVSPDGKTVTLFAVKPDGTRTAVGAFPAGPEGEAVFMEKFGSLPTEVRLSLMQSRASAAQTQANSDREFDLRKKENESNQQYRERMLAIQQSQESRARATHSATMEDAKIPPGVKLQAASLADQMKSVSNALNKAMAEGQFNPENPGTAKLMKEQADLRISYQRLLTPYTPKTSESNGLPDASVFDKKPPAETQKKDGASVGTDKPNPPPSPPYVPGPTSPAGQAAARREQMVQGRMQEQAAMTGAASQAAAAAISARDPAAAAQVQSMPGFGLLSRQEQIAIRQIVFGR